VLSAVADSNVPVPRVVVSCPDPEPIGVPFYLTEFVDGIVVRDAFPPAFAEPADRRAALLELARTLADVHAIDWRAGDLASLSRPTGFLERQLRRWQAQWEHNATREVPDVEALAAWLERHRPAQAETTLVHGDFKLDNVILAAEPPARILAVVDWEMAALGDPLADIGLLLAVYVEPGEVADPMLGFSAATSEEGCPTRAELLEAYAQRSGRSLEHLRWYECMAIWKISIILEGSYRRLLAGSTANPFLEQAADGVPRIAARALARAHGHDD
jgi:aminoglycoside phosphotransferase (APT) family kinase protein